MASHLIEQLESRRLMSAAPHAGAAAVIGKVLAVSGTADADVIVVGLNVDRKTVSVQMTNGSGTSTRTFPKASFSNAVILGGAGDDVLIVDEAFGRFVPTLMIGGSGGDMLSGGSGGDVLVGDGGRDVGNVKKGDALAGVANGILHSDKDSAAAGDDVLMGNGGDDWIFGGRGNDVAFGGDGNDVLDGGEGSNFLVGEAGRNHVRARSATDVVLATRSDVVDATPGAQVLS